MDVIELDRDELEGDWGGGAERFDVVAVRINGEELRVLVVETQRAELTQRWETEDYPRENYASLEDWLAPDHWMDYLGWGDVAPPSRHWLGEPDPILEERGRAAVLTCTCRCYGCGGAAARITIEDDDVVTWSDFRLANSDTLVPIGPFRFDRAAYEAAIAAL